MKITIKQHDLEHSTELEDPVTHYDAAIAFIKLLKVAYYEFDEEILLEDIKENLINKNT